MTKYDLMAGGMKGIGRIYVEIVPCATIDSVGLLKQMSDTTAVRRVIFRPGWLNKWRQTVTKCTRLKVKAKLLL